MLEPIVYVVHNSKCSCSTDGVNLNGKVMMIDTFINTAKNFANKKHKLKCFQFLKIKHDIGGHGSVSDTRCTFILNLFQNIGTFDIGTCTNLQKDRLLQRPVSRETAHRT